MAATDSRTTIMGIISTYITANPLKKDDGATNATTIHIWEGGPEPLKYLFYGTPAADVVISYGEPQSSSRRPIQDKPVHYDMVYPVTVTTVDKPVTGASLTVTASRMQYKVTYALRAAVAASAQSASGASPAYTLMINSDGSQRKMIGGLQVYETQHRLVYETSYGG